jgi:phosphatidylglycerol---prolipoprotein diacylglyceryl transferase
LWSEKRNPEMSPDYPLVTMLSYFIWDASRELFSIGVFTLKWNAVLFVLAFLISQQTLLHIYKKEGRPLNDIGILISLLIIAALVGSRLAHVFLYEPELILSKPLEIFLPIEFQPKFRFTGTAGLSLHGGLLGIILAVLIYSRKKKDYLQLLDRICIIAAITGTLLFTGNFLNSEIVGKPTNSPIGTVFLKPVTKGLLNLPCCIMRNPGGKNPLNLVSFLKDDGVAETGVTGHHPVILYLFFSPGATEQLVNEFLIGDVKTFLFDMSHIVHEPGTEPLHYTIFVERDGKYAGRIRTIGIARFPVQLFDAATSFGLVMVLLWHWRKRKATLPPGRLLGLSLIIFFTFHFLFGYMKEVPAGTDLKIGLTPDQMMSILFVITGIITVTLSQRRAYMAK